MDRGGEVDRVVVVDLDDRGGDGPEDGVDEAALRLRDLGGGEEHRGALAHSGGEVRHHAHSSAVSGVAADVLEAHARSDRNQDGVTRHRSLQAAGDVRQVLRLHSQQHHVRADRRALHVVRDAHAVLGEHEASRGHELRDRDVVRDGDVCTDDAAQERLAHEAAADDADAHVDAFVRSPGGGYVRRSPKIARPTRTSVAPSSIATG